ncbi:Hypothetical protein A7982_02724 [Minicystis rosea]|nr:Hypothetical protein A7982_02724 [Minicystis rosea]
MTRIATLVAVALLASLPACGPSTPPQSPDPAKEAASAAPEASASAAPSAEPTAAAEAPKPAPAAAPESPMETLARDLVKAGGRRIGYSATKKRFIVPIEMRNDGGRGLALHFYDDDGQQREVERVCQPGECEDKLNEIAKELIPKLAARLEKEGYEAIFSVGWPQGRDELESGTMKLRYEKGKLLYVPEKKGPTPLRALGGRSPKTPSLSAVYPVPAVKLLGVFAVGEKVAQEFFVFKLP